MKKKWGSIQVNRDHYFTENYLSKARFISLYGQTNYCLKHHTIGNILEIGPGPGLFSTIMKHLGYDVTTIDFDKSMKVDIAGRLPNLPIKSEVFDTVCAFEVLEHIPFDLFNICLSEMARVSKSFVIISVPDVKKLNPKLKLYIDVKLGNWKYQKNIFRTGQIKLTNPKEHYWELGINDITDDKIIDKAKKVKLNIISNDLVEPWFHFFVFQKEL